MDRNRIVIVLVGVVAIVTLIFLVTTRRTPSQAPTGGLRVVTSFYPLEHIARQVGGSYVTVEDLLPLGGEPHDYEPSVRQFATVGESDLFIVNGGGFEPWFEKWQSGSLPKPRRTVNMIDELGKRNLPLLAVNGGSDPHVWLDPVLYAKEVEVVRDALIDLDRAHADNYRAQTDAYLASLVDLDNAYRMSLAPCVQRSLVTSHDAFRYLAREYSLTEIPIAGISPDEEPSPKALTEIIALVRSKGIHHIFFETTVSPKLSETIAREVGAQTLALNPLESLTADEAAKGETYVSMMNKNLIELQTALACH